MRPGSATALPAPRPGPEPSPGADHPAQPTARRRAAERRHVRGPVQRERGAVRVAQQPVRAERDDAGRDVGDERLELRALVYGRRVHPPIMRGTPGKVLYGGPC